MEQNGAKSLPNHGAAFDENGKELGIVFATLSPFDTPFHMEALLQWHREAESDTGRLQERMDARPMELTPGARRILELLNTEQTLTLGQVVRLTGLPESTAKVRIKELLGVGRLLRHGQGKGTYYTRG